MTARSEKSVNYLLIAQFVLTVFVLLPIQSYSANLDNDFRKAAQKGQIERVDSYLSQGALINSVDNNGRTALMLAAENGYLEIVRTLVLHGADISLTDNKGESALHKAIRKNNIAIAEILKYGEAKRENTIEGYDQYLKEYPGGAYVSEVDRLKQNIINEERIRQETRKSVENDDIVRLKELISEGAGVADADLMRVAVEKGFVDIVRLLIEHGSSASPTKMLYLAAGNGNMEMAKLLKENGAGHQPPKGTSIFLDGKYIEGGKEQNARMVTECEGCLKEDLQGNSQPEFLLIDLIQKMKTNANQYGQITGLATKYEVFMMAQIIDHDGKLQTRLGKYTFTDSMGTKIDRTNTYLCPPRPESSCLPDEE